MFITRCIIIVIITLNVLRANAQQEDTTSTTALSILVIPQLPNPNKVDLILSDSSIRLGSFSLLDIIDQQSALFVKSYGVNGVSNVNFRGGKAEHSRIYYKEADLSLLNIGQLDLSLYPIGAGNFGSLSYGDAAKELGGDAINGALSFGQFYTRYDTLNVMTSLAYSSLLNVNGLAKVEAKLNDKMNASAFIQYSGGENRFTFTNPYLLENKLDTMKNSTFSDLAGGVDLQWKQQENKWSFSTWHKHLFRQIPPGNSQTSITDESLEDNVHFASIGFQRDRKLKVSYTGAWLANNNNYRNALVGLNDVNSIHSFQNILKIGDGRRMNGPISWTNVIRSNYSMANSPGLDGAKSIHDLSYYGKASYQFVHKFRITVGLRTGINNAELIGLLPSASITYRPKLNNHFVVMANSSINKRYPTLNELYWSPGGNLNLQEERIAISELGIKINRKLKFGSLSSSLFAYFNITDNWTQWVPGATYWSPINLKQVVSKGLELDISLKNNQYRKLRYNLGLKVNYNLTLNKEVYDSAFVEPNNEVIYNPNWNVNVLASLSYKTWTLNYHQPYVSRYFISNDNLYFMPSYSTANFRIIKSFKKHFSDWRLAFVIDNILDWQYQVIPGRPMPGRVYSLNIVYNLKK